MRNARRRLYVTSFYKIQKYNDNIISKKMSAFGVVVDAFLGVLSESSPSPLVGWLLQALALLQALSPVEWPAPYPLYSKYLPTYLH